MARGLNKAMLIGRLGADPEIRYTASGMAVANMRIATNHAVRRGEEWVEETEWHSVVAWDRLAEVASQYLGKGRQVYVEGRLQTREWQDRDGNRRWTTEIVARELILLGSRDDVQQPSEAEGGSSESGYTPPGQAPPEDDVPF